MGSFVRRTKVDPKGSVKTMRRENLRFFVHHDIHDYDLSIDFEFVITPHVILKYNLTYIKTRTYTYFFDFPFLSPIVSVSFRDNKFVSVTRLILTYVVIARQNEKYFWVGLSQGMMESTTKWRKTNQISRSFRIFVLDSWSSSTLTSKHQRFMDSTKCWSECVLKLNIHEIQWILPVNFWRK